MRDYELVVIINPQVTDEEIPKVIDKVTGLIVGKGGTITELNQWGRRKLAYPISQHSEGNYVLTRFKLKSGLTKEIESNLHLSNEVIRHLLVKVPESQKSEKYGKSE